MFFLSASFPSAAVYDDVMMTSLTCETYVIRNVQICMFNLVNVSAFSANRGIWTQHLLCYFAVYVQNVFCVFCSDGTEWV